MIKKIFSYIGTPRYSFITLVVVAILVAFVTRILVSSPTQDNSTVAPLGTLVTTNIMSLKVESVREDPLGAPPFTPREGNTFIIPTLVITNTSDVVRDLIPTLTLYVKDDAGNIYNMAIAPTEGEQFGGPVLPHDTVRQEIAFEVKKGAKNLVLYFETGGIVLREKLEKDSSLFR